MIPTGRLLGLLLGATVPLALSALWPPAVWAFAGWLVAALGLLAVDWRYTPLSRAFKVERRHESRLSLGVPNVVRIRLESASSRSVRVWVRDEHPPSIEADATVLSLVLPPLGRAEVSYHLQPRERGDYRFGAINLRYRSVLGLFMRQVSFDAEDSVRVYPNLLELRKYDLLARRGALQEAGLRQARLQGRGTEFERLREYLPDDDYRRIHWKATARRGKPITIEYEAERSQNVVIMLDAGRLMASQVGALTKLDHALNSALLVAYVAAQRGDRVALLAFADRVSVYLPPLRGRRSFPMFLEALYNLRAQRVEPDFGRAFYELARRQLKRSLLLLFTDLAEPEACAGLLTYLANAARRHLPVCITIGDPVLAKAAAQQADTSRAVYERAVAQRLLDERQEVLGTLRQRGVVTLDVPAEHLTPQVVNTYLELKARTRL